jgi:uncharacterized membrane protein YphA (DoxX/SURF4 family)
MLLPMMPLALLSPLFNLTALCGRILVGGVFIVAGLAKLKAPSSQFVRAILGYELLPPTAAQIMAKTLPWLEVGVGLLLWAGLWSQYAAMLGAVLLLAFSGAVAFSLWRGKEHECGCFQSRAPVQWRLVYRNVALAGMLLLVYETQGGLWAVDGWVGLRSSQPIAFSSAFTVEATLWLCLLGGVRAFQRLTQLRQTKKDILESY